MFRDVFCSSLFFIVLRQNIHILTSVLSWTVQSSVFTPRSGDLSGGDAFLQALQEPRNQERCRWSFFFHYAWLVSDYAWRCLTVRLSSLWQSWPKLWSLSNFNEFYVCSIMLPVFLIIFSCTFKECFSYLSKVLNINFANLNLKASTSRITWSSRSSRSSSPDEPTASAVCSLAHAHPGSVESTWNRRNKERNLRRIFLRVKTVTFFFLYTKNVRIQYT